MTAYIEYLEHSNGSLVIQAWLYLKPKAFFFPPETLEPICKTTWRHTPEGCNHHCTKSSNHDTSILPHDNIPTILQPEVPAPPPPSVSQYIIFIS
jgi:hypothetical protein